MTQHYTIKPNNNNMISMKIASFQSYSESGKIGRINMSA